MSEILILEPMYASSEDNLVIRNSADFLSGSPVALREPIASEYIAGYLRHKGMDSDVLQHTIEDDKEMLEILKKNNPSILGVSIHSSHMFPRILRFLKKCKQDLPKTIIVCGGNHSSCRPDIVSEDCIDYVVRGEGEEIMYELSYSILNGHNVDSIRGLSYKKGETIFHNPNGQRFDFSTSFLPIRKNEILEKVKCAPLSFPSPLNQKNVAQISYSRGCKFNCKFCVSPKIFPGGIIYRKTEDVISEIKQLQEKFNTNFLFFTDLTFNAIESKVVELCDRIIEEKIKINWFCYCSMHLKENIVKKMAEAGCSRIGTGAESLVSPLLKKYKLQQTFNNIKNSLEITDKYGIINRVYIMLGYPEETKDMLDQTLERMKKLPIDQIRLAFITPFPGTLFHKEYEKDLTTDNMEKFTGDCPVIRNKNISTNQYIKLRDSMMRDFYNSKEYLDHVRAKCAKHPRLKESYKYFFEYMVRKKILERKANFFN